MWIVTRINIEFDACTPYIVSICSFILVSLYPTFNIFLVSKYLSIPASHVHYILSIPVPLYPSTSVSQYPCISVSLYLSIPVSQYPSIPVSQYPCISVSLYLSIPVICISVPLYPHVSKYPSIPVSQ